MKAFWEKFQGIIVTVILIFAAFFVYTKLAGPIPFYVNNINNASDLFTVDGTGKATGVPDEGVINIGVTQQSQTVADAQNKTNTVAQKLINDVKKLGLDDKDIKTTNYSVTPNYASTAEPLGAPSPAVTGTVIPVRPPSQNQIIGYTVTQNIEVDVKQTDKINQVIDTATKDGANLIGGVSFTFSDTLLTKLQNEARAQAINEAKTKAQSLSSLSGIHLGKLVNVVESNGIVPQPLIMNAGKASTDTNPTPTNVTPGESTVSLTVSLSYETY